MNVVTRLPLNLVVELWLVVDMSCISAPKGIDDVVDASFMNS